MPRHAIPLILLVALVPTAPQAQTQAPAKKPPATLTLPTLLSTFLADSGVATRGLPWTTGSTLPVKWNSTKPVPSQYTMWPNVTVERTGTARMAASDTSTVDVQVFVLGNDAGIQRFFVSWDMVQLPTLAADSLLVRAGFTLTTTLCDRATEGYSYGNLLQVIKAPGKKAAGLHEQWNCAQEDCTAAFVLYYRKADAEKVECAGA